MFPVHQHARGGKNQSDIHRRVFYTYAPVRTAAKNQVVPGVRIGKAIGIEPPFGDELIVLREDRRVMQRVVERGYHHAIRRNSVIIGDGESLGRLVRNLTKGFSVRHQRPHMT